MGSASRRRSLPPEVAESLPPPGGYTPIGRQLGTGSKPAIEGENEGPWVLFARSEEADAFRNTVEQIEGRALPPPGNDLACFVQICGLACFVLLHLHGEIHRLADLMIVEAAVPIDHRQQRAGAGEQAAAFITNINLENRIRRISTLSGALYGLIPVLDEGAATEAAGLLWLIG
jgi:hypothetical protein